MWPWPARSSVLFLEAGSNVTNNNAAALGGLISQFRLQPLASWSKFCNGLRLEVEQLMDSSLNEEQFIQKLYGEFRVVAQPTADYLTQDNKFKDAFVIRRALPLPSGNIDLLLFLGSSPGPFQLSDFTDPGWLTRLSNYSVGTSERYTLSPTPTMLKTVLCTPTSISGEDYPSQVNIQAGSSPNHVYFPFI